MHEQLHSASGNCRKIISLHLQPRNSPTVLNAGFQFAQFWDGRSSNLEAQAKEPMLNPDEMGLTAEADLLKRLRGLKTYQTRFPEAFSDGTEPITITSARHSIVSGGCRIHCGIPPLPLRQRTSGASAALIAPGKAILKG
jgi:cytochrome c peroxidase